MKNSLDRWKSRITYAKNWLRWRVRTLLSLSVESAEVLGSFVLLLIFALLIITPLFRHMVQRFS